ncbi:cobalamin biosynthesis protein CobW [Deltaproteobacteria bacterium]|nr:cobalamin biosynthesis protein CobW [Deltaproteobacteria bacterium]
MTARVPVLVVGGFLGSGKTTLVRHLLADAQARGLRMAVISNEFGELGIDAALLGEGASRMVELAGGCVCCSLSDALVDTLMELRTKVNPDRIVIEASGVALPFDAQLHLYRPPVRDWVGDEACVVVVDAERAGEADPLFAEQVQSADLVILSKIDLVDARALAAARARVAELAPEAPILEAIRGNVPIDLVFPAGPRPPRGPLADASDAHDHDHHHDDWESVELAVPGSLSEEDAWSWIFERHGVRTKGFVSTTAGPRIVQGVGGRLELTPLGELTVDPQMLGRVVVIRRSDGC